MPELDQISKDKLGPCHPNLQRVINEVTRHLTIEVKAAFIDHESQGSTPCTHMEYGKSPHNTIRPTAVDVALVPEDWDDRDGMVGLLWYFQGVADRMKIPIRTEYPNHIELVGDYKERVIYA